MENIRNIISIAFILYCNMLAAQTILFEKSYGAAAWDTLHTVEQTTDGGFIMSGVSNGPAPIRSYFIKTNSKGDTIWTKEYPFDLIIALEWLSPKQ
ncbi:MAG: hypothetical protein SGJ10_08720 [Bacteroidota bacterium]|nr:hypothetical protein [Bacteroidota bacterium]